MNKLSSSCIRSTTVLTLLLASCGSASFQSGGVGGNSNAKPRPQTPPITSKMTSLTWYWQCNSDPGAEPATKDGDVVLSGEGSHEIAKDTMGAGVPVTIGGRVCPPAKYPRDIVFVIDVSGSMIDRTNDPGSDPVVNGSCGRLAAVEEIIANITKQGGDTKFGIVTFATTVVKQSSALFASKDNLYADIAAGTTPAGVLCAGLTDTYYGVAMTGAETLLKGNSSRTGALKEIYFVSDGVPSDATKGLDVASRLKAEGVDVQGTKVPVQIATVMLGDAKDTQLKPLASLDKSNVPLHAVAADSSKLAATLSSLAANEIDDGMIRYRAMGSDKWTEVALKPNMKGYDFSIPAFQITPESAPNGLEVNFEYKDQHNNKYSSGGNITWSVKKK